jgi:hypothetical protein
MLLVCCMVYGDYGVYFNTVPGEGIAHVAYRHISAEYV